MTWLISESMSCRHIASHFASRRFVSVVLAGQLVFRHVLVSASLYMSPPSFFPSDLTEPPAHISTYSSPSSSRVNTMHHALQRLAAHPCAFLCIPFVLQLQHYRRSKKLQVSNSRNGNADKNSFTTTFMISTWIASTPLQHRPR